MALKLIDAKEKFGIQADDGKDYTEELQAAAALSSKAVSAGDAAQVVLPPGDIKHSATFVIKGNASGAPWFQGTYGDGENIRGTRLVWAGAPNTIQLFFQEFNKGRFWDIAVDGQDIAGRNIEVGGHLFGDPMQRRVSFGFSFQRCKFSRVKPGVVGNGCLALGTDPALTGNQTWQVSEWSIRDCTFMPESSGAAGFSYAGMKAFAFRTLAPGNVQNGELVNIDVKACDRAIDWERSSGYLRVQGFRMSNVRRAFSANSGRLTAESGVIECGNVDDFRLLIGTGQIGCFATIKDVKAGWKVADGVSPLLWEYAGALTLEHGEFECKDQQDSVLQYWMKHGAPADSQFGSFISRQNWYRGCGTTARPYIPLMDGSQNDLAPVPNTYGGVQRLHVSSEKDLGGSASSPLRLRPFDSSLQGTPP